MENELKRLYHLAKTLQNTVNNVSTSELAETSSFVNKYNDLFSKISEIDGDVKKYCNAVEVPRNFHPLVNIRAMNGVKVELNTLIAYLEKYMGNTEEFIEKLTNFLKAKLRFTFKEPPETEREVQDKVDILLNVGNYKYLREKVTIPYSSKHFIPDFTFDNQSIVLEIKFCNKTGKEKELIDEINGDIQAYKIRYKYIVFLVYDIGLIRDVQRFRQDISNDLDVYVEVIKH